MTAAAIPSAVSIVGDGSRPSATLFGSFGSVWRECGRISWDVDDPDYTARLTWTSNGTRGVVGAFTLNVLSAKERWQTANALADGWSGLTTGLARRLVAQACNQWVEWWTA